MSGKLGTHENDADPKPGTLGAVLYAGDGRVPSREKEWVDLVRAVGAGNRPALHALYRRAHRLIFTLTMRITNNRQTAEELTLDVFHDVWRNASSYDPAGGTVVGWMLNQARSRAIDRLRFQRRLKRLQPQSDDWRTWSAPRDGHESVAFRQQTERVRDAVGKLSPDEREAIETAYFSELTHREVAARLQQPLGTVKTRIRSGLAKLRTALAHEDET